MKIATFNINGIKARIDALPQWLDEAQPERLSIAAQHVAITADKRLKRIKVSPDNSVSDGTRAQNTPPPLSISTALNAVER